MVTKEAAERLRRLYHAQLSAKDAHQQMQGLGFAISYRSVCSFYRAHRQFLEGREEQTTTRSYVFGDARKDVLQLVKELYEEDPHKSEAQIVTEVTNRGYGLTRDILRVMKKELHLMSYSPRYGQEVSEANKVKRVAWCQSMIDKRENFNGWLFSDESVVVHAAQTGLLTLSSAYSADRIYSRTKFPKKAQIWGVISRRGTGPLVFLEDQERLNALSYIDICRNYLLPHVDACYGRERAVFMQDGAPCHRARITMEMFRAEGITVADWAAQSPDLNPIEYIWGQMKKHLREKRIPKTYQDLKEAIVEFWDSITPQQCSVLVDHCIGNMHKIVASGGVPILDGAPDWVYA